MTPKFGSGQQKPALTPKKEGKPTGPEGDKGLKRKDGGTPGSKLAPTRKDDKDKPLFGDVSDEGLDDALADVNRQLEAAPENREHHVRKFKILRKMGDRPQMRSSLQAAARACNDPFFGVKLAEALEEEGSYGKALEWRLWVAQFEPDDPDTIRRLAATAVRAGNLPTAEQSYAHLIELKRNDEAPLGGTFYEEMLGKGLSTEDRVLLQHMGIRLLAKALSYQPENVMLLDAAAKLAYRVRELEAARQFYERAINGHPQHRNIRDWKLDLLKVYALSGSQSEWHELNESFINELSEYAHQQRSDSRAWNTLAGLQIQAGRFEDALATLKNALVADSKNSIALWELGRLYVRLGRAQEAIEYYEEIIRDPNEKKSVRRAIEKTLAELYFKDARFQEALEIYHRDPDSNLVNIALNYEALDEVAAAEELYHKAVKQSPRMARGYLGLAEYYVRRQDWQKAAESSRDGLIKCNYVNEEVESNLAVALATAQMKMGQVAEALSTMEDLCQSYPDSIHQVFRKAKLLKMLGREEEALAMADEVRTSAIHQTGCAPASSSLWSLLGDCNSLLNDIAGAEEAYTKALRYDFMDSVAVRGLGIVAEKKGDLKRALQCYERFVRLDPLNLATPAIRNRIKELIDKVGPLEPEPEPEPAPGPARGPQMAATPQAGPPPQGGAWLGGGDSMEWYDQN